LTSLLAKYRNEYSRQTVQNGGARRTAARFMRGLQTSALYLTKWLNRVNIYNYNQIQQCL